jgi:Zn-finger nucleic acid-binding protein
MIILEHQKVEIDYCLLCEGVWLDAGELERLYEDETAFQNLVATGREIEKSVEKKRRCPICGKKMDKVEVGTADKVLYDRCPRGHGLWLDKGELDAIVRIGHPAAAGSIMQGFLGDVFHHGKK